MLKMRKILPTIERYSEDRKDDEVSRTQMTEM